MNEDLKAHLIESLEKGVRIDGRKLDEYRKVEIKTGVSKTAEGSAHVKMGDTELFVGVKMEVGKPYPDRPNEGTIMVGAELLPLSSPDYESGPPTIKSVELARVVDRGLRESGALDFKKLLIKAGEECWIVNIDIVTLNDDGNLIDASALGALAAVKDAKLPEYKDGVIDFKTPTKKGLKIEKLPIAVTVIKIGNNLIVDPTSDEENATDSRLTVTSTEDGNLCALQKGESAALTVDDIDQMVNLGIKKASELRALVK